MFGLGPMELLILGVGPWVLVGYLVWRAIAKKPPQP